MTFRPLLSLLCIPVLSACASIVEGSGQNIAIQASHPTSCIVENKRGLSSIMAPTSVTVKRSKTDLHVRCLDAYGTPQQKTVESSLEDWFWGDVALLSALGVFIDAVSGAMWAYPDTVAVPDGVYTAPQAAPQIIAPQAATPLATVPTTVAPVAPAGITAPVAAPQQPSFIAPLPFSTVAPAAAQ